MKTLYFFATVGTAILTSSTAMASDAGTTVTNRMNVQEVRDRSQQDVRASTDVFKSVRGVYDLDDGTTLSLYRNGRAVVAEVSGQAPVEVLLTKTGTFVGVDGATRIKFIHDAAGQVAKVVVNKLG